MKFPFEPIGVFRCSENSPVLVPRQGVLAKGRTGRVELNNDIPLDALSDLTGFTKIWLLFVFDRSKGYSAKVCPPHREKQRGVFATRAPRRPNPIGLSAVNLIDISERIITVSEYDLLDGTPILDIKPYLPYADAFTDASAGWVDDEEKVREHFDIMLTPDTEEKVEWLSETYSLDLKSLINEQLSIAPKSHKRKRICVDPENMDVFIFAWRTWRFSYTIKPATISANGEVNVDKVYNVVSQGNISNQPDQQERISFNNRFRNSTP
jgi:tRNA-Thr(GGU) m(6)t(6)A37 methyltransferase TsaA